LSSKYCKAKYWEEENHFRIFSLKKCWILKIGLQVFLFYWFQFQKVNNFSYLLCLFHHFFIILLPIHIKIVCLLRFTLIDQPIADLITQYESQYLIKSYNLINSNKIKFTTYCLSICNQNLNCTYALIHKSRNVCLVLNDLAGNYLNRSTINLDIKLYMKIRYTLAIFLNFLFFLFIEWVLFLKD
jgi:hypothetical protein